ncbi:N-acetyl-1-D-myo-inositol-2-amino-2-deoxy-alpha-D-glucopyranoside deacetylase [Pilimelia columellifera]|uniref:1D-myo-inositol 2-acetamido-2-deoxy-alpha-D-glucopyranoside deacetylase n=1 Tax=Pilimelia columellifera subsp. columellifera TaxID=706583 RepID=A0ABN3N697_9ACTN
MARVNTPANPRRIVFVHAHPDDEVIGTGATMAHYAATGAHVTLVTCTLGEEGEIHLPHLAGLAADRADQLGGYRIAELAASCAALGVRDQRFLGGAGRYRDSGMMGEPTNGRPRAFWGADLDEAAAHLVEVYREVRPQVVVTYDPNGFYGHPDHIQAHRVTMRAAELAAEGGFAPRKIYWTAVPLSALTAGIARFRDSAENPFAGVESAAELPFGTPDEQIAALIAAPDHQDAKLAALRAHATQVPEDSWLHTVATGFSGEDSGHEHYRLGFGERGPGHGPWGWERDLFAGIEAIR